MRYWKTSILWICLTPWHLACFGGGGCKCEHAWGSVASNNSIKALPSPFPEQFSGHISCPLRKGSFEGRRCSTLCKRGLGRRAEMWSCQDHLPASGGNELLSAGVHDPPLCQLQNLCRSLWFFFTDIFEGFSCSRDKYRTPEGGKDFEAFPEMC